MGIKLRNLEEFYFPMQFPCVVGGSTPGLLPDATGGAARPIPVPFDCTVRAELYSLDSGATGGSCTVAIEDTAGTDVTNQATVDNADAAATRYELSPLNNVTVRRGTLLRAVVSTGLTGATTEMSGWLVLKRTGNRDTL